MSFQERLNVVVNSVFDADGFKKLQASLRASQAQARKTQAQLQSLGAFDPYASLNPNSRKSGGTAFMPGGGNFELSQARNIRKTTTSMQRMKNTMSQLGMEAGSLQPLVSSNHKSFRNLGDTTSRGSSAMGKFKGKVRGATSRLGKMIPSAHALQMQLLGLQFQMLTLALIFVGLGSSALSAVGVFEVLGNTLKFLFLPAALDVLGPVLDIQDAVMGMSREMRRTIGTISFMIGGLAFLGMLVAALSLSFSSIIAPIASVLATLLGYKTVMAAVTTGINFLLGAAGGMISLFAGILSAVASAAVAFTVIHAIFEKFDKVVGTIIGVLVALGAAIAAFIVGPFLLTAVLVGVAVGAIVAVIWNMKDEIISAISSMISFVINGIFWMVNKFVGLLEWLYNVIVGNSIIPDLVDDIISWLMKLPSKALEIGSSIVNNIVKGIKGVGNGIFNAFKKVLPDFVVDSLGSVGDFASGIADTAGSLNPFGGNDPASEGGLGGSGTTQQNITVNADMTQGSDTPQEEKRKLGQQIGQLSNNSTGNMSGGF